MRTMMAAFTFACAAMLLAAGTSARDKKGDEKPTTLKGKITCNKCDLGKSDACETVIVVKNNKRTLSISLTRRPTRNTTATFAPIARTAP